MYRETGADFECWCREVTFNPAALILNQGMQNNQSCICKRCATTRFPNSRIQRIEAKLYCAKHCHLCEEAKLIISNMGIAAENIDIVVDDELFQKYRLRIPVLQRVDNNAELDWPFDNIAISRFLMNLN